MSDNECNELSLLDKLRLNLVVVNPTTVEEERQKMKLIIKHQSEFPVKLRPSIAAAALEHPSPKIFLSEVYKAVKDFVFGISYVVHDDDNDDDNNCDNDVDNDYFYSLKAEWDGLDHDVDTQDEAEVAIRFFPRVLTEQQFIVSHFWISDDAAPPIYFLTLHARAVSFLPLFLELSGDVEGAELQDHWTAKLLMQLLLSNNTFHKYTRINFGKNSDDSKLLDDECLAALIGIKEKSMVRKEIIHKYDLLLYLLNKVDCRDRSFIERRIRLLIDWSPSLLVECGNHLSTYIPFLETIDTSWVFEVIVELGMFHYPDKLGFVFHNSNYQHFSRQYGSMKVAAIIRDKLLLSSSNTSGLLQSLILAAATNDEISLDGLSAFLGSDPFILTPSPFIQ